ncbi:WXG100 family type VII secretion target [Streptomyces sp. V4I23]|uniref:WXG100 family type VII secretion target n=1 Tax=Streptomyces sp. V4I23 TaxID=3042282 RepID=UPI00277EF9BE|nr:WXG100 family type VII secretion target [Streptomyces sp. V4I23]MDQ1005805.1 WXG100 family type VII secretion target [Streptomyces sp. V4I23]MDQ1005951.1 WXG100 family type VII secretion target [Streptomyces sp. V4I23]
MTLAEEIEDTMDFSDGYIYVDYNHADNAAEDMVSQSQAIMSILANLEMELTELKNTWIGDDRDVYTEVQGKWDQAVENIKILLASHSALLTEISGNYKFNESSLSQRWGDIRIGSH